MGSVLEIHGLQMVSHGDPLGELPHPLPLQNLHQLGLARQDDLYELLCVRLQVRDQPDLLKHRRFQILRLINHENDRTPFGILLEKEQVEGVKGTQVIGGVRWDT
jgi:hypothetical protein